MNEDYEYQRQFLDMSIPDNILQSFDQRFEIAKMLTNPAQYDHSSIATHNCHGHVYEATIHNIKRREPDKLHRQLTIKLSNNEFCVGHHYENYESDRCGGGDWSVLHGDVLDEMPHLKSMKIALKAELF